MVKRITRLGGLLAAYQRRDPAARSKLEVFLLYPGVHAILYHRVAHWLYRHHRFFLARCVSQWSRFWTGIEIHPGARIGRRLVIDHGSGIVIGETTEIGDDCLLYQGVTLGGTGKDQGQAPPHPGEQCDGGVRGQGAGPPHRGGQRPDRGGRRGAAGEVPANSTAVGVPARIARVAGQPVYYADDVDQIHMADPLLEEINTLTARLEALEKQLSATKDRKERTA